MNYLLLFLVNIVVVCSLTTKEAQKPAKRAQFGKILSAEEAAVVNSKNLEATAITSGSIVQLQPYQGFSSETDLCTTGNTYIIGNVIGQCDPYSSVGSTNSKYTNCWVDGTTVYANYTSYSDEACTTETGIGTQTLGSTTCVSGTAYYYACSAATTAATYSAGMSNVFSEAEYYNSAVTGASTCSVSPYEYYVDIDNDVDYCILATPCSSYATYSYYESTCIAAGSNLAINFALSAMLVASSLLFM
jgi:hypothetical protein